MGMILVPAAFFGFLALGLVLPDEFELVSIWTETLTLMLCSDRATRRGRRRGFA